MNSGLNGLRNAVPKAKSHVAQISRWSVGEHIHHCCLGMIGICKVLHSSSPPAPRFGVSMAGAFILLTGRIPRGRAKAPAPVVPGERIPEAELLALLDDSEKSLRAARDLDRGAWFKHFDLGVLNRDRAIRFMEIHNRHHLGVIGDILKKDPTTR